MSANSGELHFEHRVYLPSVGAVIAFSTAVFRVFHRATEQQSNRAVVKGKTAVLLHYCSAALIVIALSVATYQRNTIWKDEVSLWENVVEKSPYKARGYNNLGCLGYSKRKLVDKAIQVYQTALRLKPDYAEAHNNLGNTYSNKGILDGAILEYQTALRLKPDYAEAHNNLGLACGKKGMLDEAIQAFQTVLRLRPDFAEAYNNLGTVYANKGLLDEAINEYRIALRINPKYQLAKDNLNRILQLKR